MLRSQRPSPFSVFLKRFDVPLFSRASAYLASLSAGDKLIAGVLGTIVMIASIAGLGALESSILVRVPAHGGSLTEGIVGSPRFVNPLLALSDADRDVTTLVYAGLMGLDGDGTLKPVLAESYQVSDDGRTYTFVIRKDAKFSDGTPVTSDDVAFTIQEAQDPALKSPEFANWANIRVTVVDPRTVEFILPKPYAPFLADTALGILPAHLWRNIPAAEFPFSPLATKPIGAGPFTVADVTRDSSGTITSYEPSASPTFVTGKPYLDRLIVKFYQDADTLATAYQHGKVESAYGIPSKSVIRAPYSRVFGAFFNPDENPAFARLEVREALSLAIDRAHIVHDILGGYATPLMGPVPPGGGIEEPAIPEGDGVANAEVALTDAGWSQDPDTGIWSNAKLKLSLDSIVIRTANVPELKAVAASIQEDWKRLGVPTDVELYEPGALASKVIRPRAYQVLLFGMVIGREQDLFAFWDSGERKDPGLNIASYASQATDKLLEEARTESDPAARAAERQKISDLISADYAAAFTHAPDFLYAVPQSLYGVRLPQIASPSDRFATVSDWYRESEYVWPFLASDR